MSKRVSHKLIVDMEAGGRFRPSGEYMQILNQLHEPAPAEIRQMLTEIRDELQVSVTTLAAVLGAPRPTMRKWLDGERNPSGAAARLVWLIHTRLFAPDLLEAPGAWMVWSRART